MSREDNPEVHTTLSKQLKKLAILEDINFSEALRVGITMLSSMKELTEEEEMEQEIQKIKQQVKELEIKSQLIEKKLEELQKNKKVDPDLKNKQSMMKGLRANNPLRNIK
mgnify:CR=1 FL=1